MDVYLPAPVTNRFGSFPAGNNLGLTEAAASALVLYGGGQVLDGAQDFVALKRSEYLAFKGVVSDAGKAKLFAIPAPGVYPTHVLHSVCTQTFAVDGTSGTTFHYVGTCAAPPQRIRPIFANGGATTYPINAWSCASVPDPQSDANVSSATWTTGTLGGGATVPVQPATNRRGLLLGDWADLRNDTNSRSVAIRCHVAAGAGTITIAGSGTDLSNWAARSDCHLYRSQTGNYTVSVGGFTSTTNTSKCPIIGFQYMAVGRVFTVMLGGDSLTEGQGATYRGESAGVRYALARTGAGIAVDYCNLGWPGSDYIAFYPAIQDALAAGLIPDYCQMPIGTPNGVSTSISAADVRAMRTRVAWVTTTLAQYGAAPWLWTWMPANSNSVSPNGGGENYGATDSLRRDYNATALDWKTRYGTIVSDLSAVMTGGVDGTGQSYIVPGYTNDGVHGNDTSYPLLAAVLLADSPI